MLPRWRRQITTPIRPCASLCFFWRKLQEQVTLEGEVVRQSVATSDSYWRKRAREAQLGSWVLPQGAQASVNGESRRQVRQLEHVLGFESVPRSPNWCAFRLQSERIEFWPSGWQRMRKRVRYQKDADGVWSEALLTP